MMFNIVLCGVGGQGILTLSRIIGEAAIGDGYNVAIGETLGMSQRFGSVISFVRIADCDCISPLIPLHEADLIIALEPLEALRASYIYASNNRTKIVVELTTIPTLTTLTRNEKYPDLNTILKELKCITRCGIAAKLTTILKERNAVRSLNVALLGIAMKNKFIPLSTQSIIDAMNRVLGDKAPANVKVLESILTGEFDKYIVEVW